MTDRRPHARTEVLNVVSALFPANSSPKVKPWSKREITLLLPAVIRLAYVSKLAQWVSTSQCINRFVLVMKVNVSMYYSENVASGVWVVWDVSSHYRQTEGKRTPRVLVASLWTHCGLHAPCGFIVDSTHTCGFCIRIFSDYVLSVSASWKRQLRFSLRGCVRIWD